MKNSSVLLAAAFLCLVAFPTRTIGKYWPNDGWPNPSEASRNELLYLNTGHRFNYEDSKVWKCTYSNGSAPAISISPSTPFPSTPSTPSTPSNLSPKTSSPPPTPSPPPPAPKKSLPPPTPSPLPPAPKKTPPPPTPSPLPPAPKKTPPPPTPSPPPPAPKKSPPPPTPSLPPPTPKKPPSPRPSDDHSSSPSNPPPEHRHSHHNQSPWEHIDSCMRNMGPVGMCRMQMEVSFYTRLFRVSNYCCNLVVNMKNECDDVVWGFFNDPFFVPLVRYTCHVTC